MEAGDITSYIDVAQVSVYLFIAFFLGLVFYLRREDKREGYPLLSDRSGRVVVQGFPSIPRPKSFWAEPDHVVYAPQTTHDVPRSGIRPAAAWPGAPMIPTGDPMRDGVGTASWANRADAPEMTWERLPAIQPLSVVEDTVVDPRDPNPVGMAVFGADGVQAGMVREVWTDRSEPQIRYLEVEVPAAGGPGRNVLLPIGFARIRAKERIVTVKAILAAQFANVPGIKDPTSVTKLEEDKITAYFAGGHLYATPRRMEPIL